MSYEREKESEGQPSFSFYQHAKALRDCGLSLIPCGGDDGKKSLVRWKRYQSQKASDDTLQCWENTFDSPNMAIVTGAVSGITVVDIDAPDMLLEDALEEFGATPIVVSTPRGGYHLYYRFNGEKSYQDVTRKIDVRGTGGYVLAPPSLSPVLNREYLFISGCLDDFCRLNACSQNLTKPDIFSDDACSLESSYKNLIKVDCFSKDDTDQAFIGEGQRNQYLFKELRRKAFLFVDKSDFIELAQDINLMNFKPLLPEQEVIRTAAQVWKYKEEGRIVQSGQRYALLYEHEIETLSASALQLLALLRKEHNGIRRRFHVSPKGLAGRMKWGHDRVRKARDELLALGLLCAVDLNVYSLSTS